MKILFVGNEKGHLTIFDEFNSHLVSRGIELDFLDIFNFRIINWNKEKSITNIPYSKILVSIRRFRIYYRSYIIKKHIKSMEEYDIINFQYAIPKSYLPLINALRRKSKKIALTLWGSDYFRRDRKNDKKFIELLEAVDWIYPNSEGIYINFIEEFPSYAKKCNVIPFGNGTMKIISKIKSQETLSIIKKHFSIEKYDLIITCGYNASSAQRHLIIIDAIKQIIDKIPKNILFVFPMTYYLNDKNYLINIKNVLKQSEINYLIFDSILSIEDVARLRIATDIAVNIQTTDSAAGSIQEHLFSGNVVLVGDWLPYEFLAERNIYFEKTSIAELPKNVKYCIDNVHKLKVRAKKNPDILYSFRSWDIIIKDWIAAYGILLEGQIESN